MTTKKELELAVSNAKHALNLAETALHAFNDAPENNLFDNLDDAVAQIKHDLIIQAFEDCKDAYDCGDDSYSKNFYVGETLYRGTAEFEYSLHYKTYYYIKECKFTYEKVK